VAFWRDHSVNVSAQSQQVRQCFGRVSRTEELLRGDQQVGDGLFDLRELLLGLHCVQC
jgi:hypothetical protein